MNYKSRSKIVIKNKVINTLIAGAACLFTCMIAANSLIEALSFSSEAIFTQGVITGRHSKKVQPKNRNAPMKTVYLPVVKFKTPENEEKTFTDQRSMNDFDFPHIGTEVKVAYLADDLSSAKIYYGTLDHYTQAIIFIALFLMFLIMTIITLMELMSGRTKEDQP